MHYVGMFAMQVDARMEFDLPMVGVSVLVAVALGTFGIWTLISPAFQHLPFRHLISASLAGLAIPFMHYTAMLAVRFSPTEQQVHSMVAAGNLLSLNIFLLLAVALVGLPMLLTSLLEGPSDKEAEA
jgi:NO-binding membrane sensor protein with MHYT domain